MQDRADIQSPPNSSDLKQTDSLNLLNLQIRRHHKLEQSRSTLAQVVKTATNWVWNSDDESLSALEKLSADITESRQSGDLARTADLEKKAVDAIKADQHSLALRRDVNQYGTGFLKALFLFSKGPTGAIGTAVTYGFDQMHAGDSAGAQTFDFVLGGLKGAGMKYVFEKVGAKAIGPVGKGALLGLSNSAIEVGFNRQSFLNPATGKYSLNTGVDNILSTCTDWRARGADAAVFAGASGLFGLANYASAGALEQKKRLGTLVLGASFGVAGGGSRELMRQRAAGENLDLWEITKHSLIQGVLDTAAAGPGASQAGLGLRRQSQSVEQRVNSSSEREQGPVERGGESQAGPHGDSKVKSAAMLRIWREPEGESMKEPQRNHARHDKSKDGGSAGAGADDRIATADGALAPNGERTLESRPISEILRSIRNSAAHDRHDLSLYARAFEGSDLNGTHFLGSGANTVRIGLVNGNVMKITLAELTPEMGSRPFDLPILKRGVMTGTRLPVSYFVQPEAYPVIEENYRLFRSQLEAQGYYLSDPGMQQVGYYQGRTYLLCPFAVAKLPERTEK